MIITKYSSGSMEISPEGFFKVSAKKTAFHKLIEMSEKSDLLKQ